MPTPVKIRYNQTIRWVLLLFTILFFTTAYAQNTSNEGTEFWSVFPTHEPNNGLLAHLSVFITGSKASSGTVTAGAFKTTFTVSANSVTEVQIPRSGVYIDDTEGGQVLTGRGIHILVDSGKPKIVVYTHIFAGQRSAATLILPKDALGQQYYSMNFNQDNAGKNFITIVATEPGTQVHLKKGNKELVPGGVNLPLVNDTYEFLSDSDLTGTVVSVDSLTSGCKHFAMFSGSSGIRIGQSNCIPSSIDPLFQQNYGTGSWGKNYGYIPFSMKSPFFKDSVRTAGEFVRVMAKESNTSVMLNNTVVATLNSGQYYTTPNPLNKPAYISADKPIAVAQYALTQSCSNLTPTLGNRLVDYSDPDMVILNPVEYNIKNITLYSSTKENIAEQYINVLIKTAVAPSFRINNTVPAEPFAPMTGLPGYSFVQINLNNGYNTNTYTLKADEGFNAIAYGFGDVESYSYSAGTNLAVNQSISGFLTADNIAIDSACLNTDYYFKLRLPFLTPQLGWKMDANETETIQVNPKFVVVNVSGQNYYEYSFPKTAAYQNTGTHQVVVTAQFAATLGGCGTGQQVIKYAFKVVPLPNVNFNYTPEACHNIIDFKNKGTNTPPAGNWLWDFGDGTTSLIQNPVHAYADSGKYIVKLSVNANGCQNYYTDTLSIKQKVSTAFTVSGPNCAGSPVTFYDSSFTRDFIVASRKWYFGDGDSVVVSNKLPVQHNYKNNGRFNVTLLLTNTEGCTAQPFTKQVTVNPSLTILPDFSLPGICLSDQLAKFINLTTVPGQTTLPPLTYLWNFGDSLATASNPDTSTLQNSSHRYTRAKVYTVSLIVTSALGCSNTIVKQFTVNGANPVASFLPVGKGPVCVKDPVVFQDRSSVDFGAVTRLEWYFDDLGKHDSVQVYLNPKPGQLYTFRYPIFNSPATKTYQVRLRAYSGTQCVSDTVKTITVSAMPKVLFNSPGTVCLSAAPFKFTQASEASGLPGAGIYSGAGILSDGTFNPSIARPGRHNIRYVFTTPSGCTDSATNTITVSFLPKMGITGNFCRGSVISFADTSCIAALKNGTWKWDFGDGDSVAVSGNPAVQHVYQKAGAFTVKLTVSTPGGDISIPDFQNIVINEVAVPDFSVPGICLTDQLAQFTNLSMLPGQVNTGLTYLWDFGDPNASGANVNTSALANPVHRYTAAQNYRVSLTVTSPGGCVTTVNKPFTVNGAKPKASFQLSGSGPFCSGGAVAFQDLSSVDFGAVTKIEWFFDQSGSPGVKETYITPVAGMVYRHAYPAFHSPASKNYMVRLVAYSGTQCMADTTASITIMALPVAVLDTLGKVCVSAAPLKLVQGHELNGLAGKGVYSGKGVLTDGTFNPAISGIGLQSISYLFTSAFGCTDSVTRQIEVVAEPVINISGKLNVLQGSMDSLSVSSGSGLTYKWRPATYLNRDDVPNPIAKPDEDITYTLTVSNGTCQVTGQISITVTKQLSIPNTFTPNGDGVNDTWIIKNLNLLYPAATVGIYNKRGFKVFGSDGYGIPWDGRYNGKDMPVDTYYYIIDLKNGQKKLASWLQLIR